MHDAMMTRRGVDVSEYQGAIDWRTVQQDGIEFAFIRAMVGTRLDARLAENLSGARAAGIACGVYQVVHEDALATEQAGVLLSVLAQYPGLVLPVALDIERPMVAGTTDAHRRTLENARVIAGILQDGGYRMIVYTGAWWWNPATQGVDVAWATALDLWVATYGTAQPILPHGWSTWRFWQHTSSGTVAGIAGNVDLNVFSGDWETYTETAIAPTFYVDTQPLELVCAGRVLARIVAQTDIPEPPETVDTWVLPVGTPQYPPVKWGVRGYTHDLRPTEENPNRRNGKPWPHSGYDINLDVAPYGDIERGMPVVALTHGVVHYVTSNWSGVGMCVVCHFHDREPIYARYAHITVQVHEGDAVSTGQPLGVIADYPGEGDHLHLDMASDPFTREWIDPSIHWVDPAPILKAHIDPDQVDAMLRVGD